MVTEDRINLDNLFSLYSRIGELSGSSQLHSSGSFSVVHTASSVWPNTAFGITAGDLDESILDHIVKEMQSMGIRPLLALDERPDSFALLKTKGFMPIDRWTGMHIALPDMDGIDRDKDRGSVDKDVVGPDKNENSHDRDKVSFEGDIKIGCIHEKSAIADWTRLVSDSLYKGAALDPDVFQALSDQGAADLIGLWKGDELIGSTMIYKDHQGIAGLYMVAVRESYRGKGLASRMIKYCLRSLKDSGNGKCYLQATKAGLPLYQSVGFTASGNYLIWCKIK